MIKHFRPEFEAHIEDGRARRQSQRADARPSSLPRRGAPDAGPRAGSPSRSTAARCARPRASGCSTRPSAATSRSRTSVTSRSSARPVGACRMCMVEVEGIPKLQTSCSTPVKDGMVVYTQTDRVKHAQNAVVEFLLVNHPLDCPVCDKGGECPLQDISYGWGPGRSRFVEPKRNFPKPIALSPLIAIDRERCILCYRCVRFSQEVAEDDQLAFLERADHTFVGTFDGRPYVAPFSGNVIELCPVGALTNTAYRFRARPWDIEDAGLGLHALPEPVQRRASRSATSASSACWRATTTTSTTAGCATRAAGATSRSRSDGAHHAAAGARRRHLRPATWERALDAAADGLAQGRRRVARRSSAGTTTNEEGYLLQRIFREALGSPQRRLARRRRARRRRPRAALAHPRPRGARSPTSTAPRSCWCSRRDPIERGADLRPAPAQGGAPLRRAAGGRRRARPTALDGGATRGAALRARRRRGAAARAPEGAARGGAPRRDGAATATPAAGARTAERCPGHAELAEFLAEHSARAARRARRGRPAGPARRRRAADAAPRTWSCVWGERLGSGERGAGALAALTDLALLLGPRRGARARG